MISARHDASAYLGGGNVAAFGVADGLSLAAAPTFAIMALLTSVFGGGSMDLLCAAAQDTSSLSGMMPMYVLMSAFHLTPWLRLITSSPVRRRCLPPP